MNLSRKEIVRESVKHKDAKPVPFHIPLLTEASRKIKEHFKTQDIHLATGDFIDWQIGINFEHKWIDRDHWEDEWGVIWRNTRVNRGYVTKHPLTEPDCLKIPRSPEIPGHAAKDILEKCNRIKELYLIGWCGELFERAHFLRGMENIMMDLYLKPLYVSNLLDRILEYNLKAIAFLKELPVDCIILSDDYGSQKGLLISPDKFKEFFKPRLRIIFEEIRKTGKTVGLHSCGRIEELIPDMIEIGVEILHPVQSDTMDIFSLKKTFGKDLCFYGGVSTQGLLRKETPIKIKEGVRKIKDRMSQNGGFILAPDIDIQEDIPMENLLTLIEVCNE